MTIRSATYLLHVPQTMWFLLWRPIVAMCANAMIRVWILLHQLNLTPYYVDTTIWSITAVWCVYMSDSWVVLLKASWSRDARQVSRLRNVAFVFQRHWNERMSFERFLFPVRWRRNRIRSEQCAWAIYVYAVFGMPDPNDGPLHIYIIHIKWRDFENGGRPRKLKFAARAQIFGARYTVKYFMYV